MIDLFFKIGLPVLMIGIVTLVSHRYGPSVGGILGAVPAKGGPIILFLAIDQGRSFAATSAAASLGGAGGCGVFCLVTRSFADASPGRSPAPRPTARSSPPGR